MTGSALSRRTVLRGLAGAPVVAVAGCSGRSQRDTGDVIAGPEGRLVFDPVEHTIEAGETVTWYFDSAGHNVCARPDDAESVQLPEGATPFASYDPNESALTLVPRGTTYEHRFDVPGVYQYVCVPHISAGMIGRVIVED